MEIHSIPGLFVWVISKNHQGVNFLNTQCGSLLEDTMSIQPFKYQLEYLVSDTGLTREQVCKCDKIGLNWCQLYSQKIVTGKDKESKGFKNSRERVILMA